MSTQLNLYIGRKFAGKDTIASQDATENTINLKFATPLKESCQELFSGIDIEHQDFKEKQQTFQIKEVHDKIVVDTVKFLETVGKFVPTETILDIIDDALINNNGKLLNMTGNTITISPRQYQQILGTDIGRQLHQDIWTDMLKSNILDSVAKNKQVFVTDVRFENELKELLSLAHDNDISIKVNYIFRQEQNEKGNYVNFNPTVDKHPSEKMANNIEQIILDTKNRHLDRLLSKDELDLLIADKIGMLDLYQSGEFELRINKTVKPELDKKKVVKNGLHR